ncbi:MAG: DnaJ like chaperone protein [Luteibaculaceae bacterium]|jgi:DnaJ like chaperone protein
MAKFGKILGAGLGWAFGGPLGALFGVAVGAMLDKMDKGTPTEKEYQEKFAGYRHHSTKEDFNRSLITLTAAVMQADGKVVVSELNYVKAFFKKSFGDEAAQEYLLILKEILKQPFEVIDVCKQIAYYMEEPSKLQLVHYLFGIAISDDDLAHSEVELIHKISIWIGISERDFRSIYSMFARSQSDGQYQQGGRSASRTTRPISQDFEILEVDQNADDAAIKKAYRKMAKKYHPDLVAHLGEEHVKGAKEKFQQVQQAYDRICKAKNIV